MKLPAYIQMDGNKIKIQKIKQALDFADPKAMMNFIKIASSSKQGKTNQMHLLLQALQWISGEFATMNQEYASKLQMFQISKTCCSTLLRVGTKAF
jgi:hypothetical protein